MVTVTSNDRQFLVYRKVYDDVPNCNILMQKEANRLQSYKNWPCKFLNPSDLAKLGFYFINKDDIVRCAFCNIEIGEWIEGDNAMQDHAKWSTKCPLVLGLNCGNVPIEEAAPVEQDSYNANKIEIRPNAYPECEQLQPPKQVQKPKGPAYLSYITLESRLKSFATWPTSLKLKPEALATAGFFYNGKKDQSICFYCGGGLNDWADDDVPWEQHARWFSKCRFVQLHKGQEFISDICNKDPAVLTSEQAANLMLPNLNNLKISEANEQHSSCLEANNDIRITPNSGLKLSMQQDTVSQFGIEIRPNAYSEQEHPLKLSNLGVQPSHGPAYSQYTTLDSRLQSFAEWPCSLKQKPHTLASAGLFYNGKGDQTICFYCGGGLNDWKINEDPWEQHAKWFPKCNFLILQKGEDYISKLGSSITTDKQVLETNNLNTPTTVKPAEIEVNNVDSKMSNINIYCKICFEKEIGVVFLPCGHVVACVDCAPALNTCAVCRKPLQATVRAFLSD